MRNLEGPTYTPNITTINLRNGFKPMEKYWKVTQQDVGRELGNPNYITYLENLLKDQNELGQDDLHFIKKAIANLAQASLLTKNGHTDTIVRGVRNTLKGLVILINEARKDNE